MSPVSYSAASIETLEGLEPVQRRPGMYTDPSNPFHCLLEILDNAADECLSGFGSKVIVRFYADGSVSVQDNGRGIPVDEHPVKKIPAIEVIMTTLHAGAKFSDANYSVAGGLHGVGVSVANALATRLEARVRRNRGEWSIAFGDGGKVVCPLKRESTKVPRGESGTWIRFWPDPQYFDSVKIPLPSVRKILQTKAVLLPGTTIELQVEGPDGTVVDEQTWFYEAGLADHLKELIDGREIACPVWSRREFLGANFGLLEAGDFSEGEGAEWALTWLTAGQGSGGGESYVNLIPTAQGGTHINGFRNVLTQVIRNFAELHEMLPRGIKIAPEDCWSSLVFILSIRLKEPQFIGQTKGKLASREALRLVETIVRDKLELYLGEHPEYAKAIADVVIQAAAHRTKKAKAQVKRKDSGALAVLPGKLSDCRGADPMRNELFLVEGDSAGGSAKQAREREFQAILPLRGKLLNTFEAPASAVMTSETTANIALAMGLEPHTVADHYDLTRMRYGKVVILADADVDGQHIQSLILALFYRHFPEVILAGRLYVAQPPLYRLDVPARKGYPRKVVYCLDEAELERARERSLERIKSPEALRVTRFKGLGEMNPDQLSETALDPASRTLVQLCWDRGAGGEPTAAIFRRCFERKNSDLRRKWIETEGNLAHIDV